MKIYEELLKKAGKKLCPIIKEELDELIEKFKSLGCENDNREKRISAER